ncbi:MAG: hypothetical protein J6V50_00190, partial [Clostridia bacterium]|nr:hypothetical protein [Clostridia bacterium]
LKGLIDNHIGDIVAVAEEKMDIPVAKDEIVKGIKDYIDENAEEIGQTFKELEPVKETIVTYSTVTETVQNTLKWYYIFGVALIGAAFLGLIYLMRKRNFGGFIWIAVDTGIVGVLVTAVVAVVKSGLIKEIIAELPSFATGIVESAIGAAATRLIIALSVCFVIMIGSIVACVLLRKRAKNMAEATTAETPTAEETV